MKYYKDSISTAILIKISNLKSKRKVKMNRIKDYRICSNLESITILNHLNFMKIQIASN